jgi:Uma2 family endonuclease
MSIQTRIISVDTTAEPLVQTIDTSSLDRNGYSREEVIYPDSDGKPMADNTKQFQIIVALHNGFEAIYRDSPDVFVAGDLLWYPVEGNNRIRTAPDVMIVFGRPKGHRGSYMQWREANIAPQVVFEILSPGNRLTEMATKFAFYARYGVEEYYLYDPDRGDLTGWLRTAQGLEVIEEMDGWVSPRTAVRFELHGDELVLFQPDGARFATYLELIDHLNKERQRVEEERQRAEEERQRAEEERQRADEERQRAETEHTRAERLAAQLRSLGVEPE